MADPTPPRPGVEGFADRIRSLEREVERLRGLSGTQRSSVAGSLASTIAWLASLRSYASSGAASVTLNNIAADGVIKWYSLSSTPSLRHIIGPIDIPTGRIIVQASLGEASHTPHDGFMQAYVSFSVRDADNKAVVNFGTHTGRTFVNQRIGLGLTTGPIEVQINAAAFRGPFTIQPFVGVWGQNTGPDKTVSCVMNGPSLRAEIIGT